VNSSIGENHGNLSNFLNNECVNIYMTWYRLYNFPLGGRDADIIDLNYKKEWNILFKSQIISGDYSKKPLLVRILLSLQILCFGLVLGNGYYSESISAN